MKLLLILAAFAALAVLYVFYDKFTRRGAIPLRKAFTDFTGWLSLLGIALADWGIELLRYLADLWQPFQSQWGELLSQPSLAGFVQLLSFVFLALKLKGQTPLPKPSLPDFPDDTDQAGA